MLYSPAVARWEVERGARALTDGSAINDCLGHPNGSMVDNIEDVDTVVGWLSEFTRPHGFAISETQLQVFILNASRRLFSDRFFTSSFRPEFYTTLGISLGGRLALTSSADCMVGISPSVITEMSPQGKWMFENFPSPGVREPYPGYVVKLLEELGPVASHTRPCLILYAERDIPAIMNGAAGLKAALPNAEVRHITRDVRPDIQHENGFIRYLPRWFNHGELKFNSEVYQSAAAWLAARA